jgi:hypothetical protein
VNCCIEGLQFSRPSTYSGASVLLQTTGPAVTFSFSHNILKAADQTNDTADHGGFEIYEAGSSIVKVWNNIVYDFNHATSSNNQFGIFNISEGISGYFYNNTVINCDYGIAGYLEFIEVINNITQDCNDGYNGYISDNANTDYNISNLSNDFPGSNSQNSTTLTFADKDGDDFHLDSTDTEAIGDGLDLSSTFSDDIDGDLRSSWDIGADENGAASNSAPSAPTALYSNSNSAQSGQTNPSGITDSTPAFSAIYNDPDSGDIANKYRVEVNTASNFSGTVMWDSGAGGTSMSNTPEGSRSPDIIYAGSPLSDNTTYYWRITFWDDGNTEGAASAVQNFATGTILSYASFEYRKSIEIDRTKIANPAGTLPIAFDALYTAQTPDTGAISLSWSHTVGSGSEGVVIVAVSTRTAATISSVTFGGTDITSNLIGSSVYSGYSAVYMYYMKNPSVGSNTVEVTQTGSVRFVGASTSFFNVDQTTPFGTFVPGTGYNDYPSVNVTKAAGQVVVAVLASPNSVAADKGIANHQVERWDRATADGTPANNIRGAGALATGSGASASIQWDLGASTHWAIGGVAVRPTTNSPPQITTVADYPLLYSVTDTDLRDHVASANGYDILFRALDDDTCGGVGLAPCTLDHEIEKYVSSTGKLVAWVRLPSVNGAAASSNTWIYIYYGNSSITQPTQNKNGVWDSDFMEVWHLGEESGNPADSTSNNYTGTIQTPANVTQDAAGNNTPAYHFAGGSGIPSYLTFTDGTLTANAPYTIEGWFYIDTTVPTWWVGFVTKDRDTANPEATANWAGLWTQGTGLVSSGAIYNKGNNLDGSTLSAGQWYYGVAVFDGGLRTLYLNGQRDPAALVSSPTVYLADMTLPLRINQDMSGGSSMTGVTDEVRVSTAVRSPGWILTTYNNMNDPGDIGSPGFYTVGAEDYDWVGPCWDGNYAYRKKMTITAGTDDIPAGYSVSVTFDHAALVSAGKSLASGDDLRVVHWDGSSWTEIDRAVDPLSTWNNGSTKIWFALVDPITASNSDGTYYLHYGYSSAVSPPDEWANVFMVGDDFNDGALTSGLTTSSAGTASISETGGEAFIDLGTNENADAGIIVTADPLPSDKKFAIRHKVKLVSGGGVNYAPAEVKAIGIAQWDEPGPTVADSSIEGTRRRIVALHFVDDQAWIQYNPDGHGGSQQASWDGTNWAISTWEKWSDLSLDTYYIYDLISNGTNWYVRVSNASGTVLTETDPVAWSVIENYDPGDPLWFYWGEVYTNAYYADQKSDWVYVRKYVDSEPTISVSGEENGCDGEATAVSLVSFTAKGAGAAVEVEWTTAQEVANAGFNLYRADSP